LVLGQKSWNISKHLCPPGLSVWRSISPHDLSKKVLFFTIKNENTNSAMKNLLPALSCMLLFLQYACSPTDNNTTAPTTERPNILFVMTDDHAQQAISAYGSVLIETPNIDRLAEEGMLFRHAYVTNSICAPSRAVILTGKYSHQNGVLDNRMVFDGSQQTFPKLLQEAGYQTAIVGKWHLKSQPTGFDYYDILPGQGRYYNPRFVTKGDTSEVEGYITDVITDKALSWLQTQRDTTQPFLLVYQHKAPHRPWWPDAQHANLDKTYPIPETFHDDYENRGTAAREAEMRIADHMSPHWDLKVQPENPLTIQENDEQRANGYRWRYKIMTEEQRAAWDAKYNVVNREFNDPELQGEALAEWKYQRYMQDYLGCVASVDENLGRVLDYLDANGLAENTIVIYTSDQGFYLGEHGWFDKRFMYEESFHTPLIVRWPEVVTPGKINEDFVMNLDFPSTMLDAAGLEIPEDMQGESILPLLRGERPEDWRNSMYYHYYEYPGAHMVKRHYGVKTDRYKLIHFYYDVDEWELYDMQNDPNELNNLIDDPDHQEIVAELKTELTRLQEQYGDSEELRLKYLEEANLE